MVNHKNHIKTVVQTIMREIRSYGSVGERVGNEPLYPEITEK